MVDVKNLANVVVSESVFYGVASVGTRAFRGVVSDVASEALGLRVNGCILGDYL